MSTECEGRPYIVNHPAVRLWYRPMASSAIESSLMKLPRHSSIRVLLFVLSALAAASCNTILPCLCGIGASQGDALPVITPPIEGPTFSLASIPTDPALYPYNHASSIIALPDGSLLVAWGAGTEELATDTRIVLSRRPAGSSGWTNPVIVADKPGRADANPVLFLAPDNVVWLIYVEMFGATFCESVVMAQTSADAGSTWTSPCPLLPTVCTLVRNHPIILKSGRWLLPAYVQGVYASQFWASDDAGGTWWPGEPMLTLPENNLQPAVVERSDGSLFALARRSGDASYTWSMESADCGRNWSLHVRDDLPNPNSGLDMVRLSTGEFVTAYNDSSSERTPLVVAFSLDEGITWSPPRIIADGPPQLSYPSLVESPDGTIHCTYSDDLTSIAVVSFNRAWLYAPN